MSKKINRNAAFEMARSGKSLECVFAVSDTPGNCHGTGKKSPKAVMCAACRKQYPSGSSEDLYAKKCIEIGRVKRHKHKFDIALTRHWANKGENPSRCLVLDCDGHTEDDNVLCWAHYNMFGDLLVEQALNFIEKNKRLDNGEFAKLVEFTKGAMKVNERKKISQYNLKRYIAQRRGVSVQQVSKAIRRVVKIAEEEVARVERNKYRREFTQSALEAYFSDGSFPAVAPFLKALNEYKRIQEMPKGSDRDSALADLRRKREFLEVDNRPITGAMLRKTFDRVKRSIKPPKWEDRQWSDSAFRAAKADLVEVFGPRKIVEGDLQGRYGIGRKPARDQFMNRPRVKGWAIPVKFIYRAQRSLNNQIENSIFRSMDDAIAKSNKGEKKRRKL